MSKITNLCPEFSSISGTVFKRKVYDTCLLYAMENYKKLREHSSEDMFPATQYYTLEDQLKDSKCVKKATGPPKKKRTPVRINSEKIVLKKNVSEDETTSETKTDEKEKKKSYPLILNKNAKTVLDFIIGRFLWEVFSIEPPSEDCPDSKSAIEAFILEQVVNEFDKNSNISQLIINSVNIFNPSLRITESYGLDKELRTKFDDHLENSSFATLIADYTTDFLKLLMLFFTNKFWLEKTQTVNIKTFETTLRYIELSIPHDCSTLYDGLIDDIVQYDKLVNSVNSDSENKFPKTSSVKKTDKKENEKKDEKNKKDDKKDKTPKKGKKSPNTRNKKVKEASDNETDNEENDETE